MDDASGDTDRAQEDLQVRLALLRQQARKLEEGGRPSFGTRRTLSRLEKQANGVADAATPARPEKER